MNNLIIWIIVKYILFKSLKIPKPKLHSKEYKKIN